MPSSEPIVKLRLYQLQHPTPQCNGHYVTQFPGNDLRGLTSRRSQCISQSSSSFVRQSIAARGWTIKTSSQFPASPQNGTE